MASHSRGSSLTSVHATIATSEAENACTTLLLRSPCSSLRPERTSAAVILILLTTGSEAQLGFVANVDHATREQLVQHLTQHPDWIQFVPWRCGEDAVLLIQSLGELVTGVRRARAVAQARTLVRDFVPFSQVTATILVRKPDDLSDHLVQSTLNSNSAPIPAHSSTIPSPISARTTSLSARTTPPAPTTSSPAVMADILVPTPIATPPSSSRPPLQVCSNTRRAADANQSQMLETAATSPLREAATSRPPLSGPSSTPRADALAATATIPSSYPNLPTKTEENNPTATHSTVSATLARIAALRAQYSHLDPTSSTSTLAAGSAPVRHHDRFTQLPPRGLPIPYDTAPLPSSVSRSLRENDQGVPMPSSFLGLSLNAPSEQRTLPTVTTHMSTTAPPSDPALLDTAPSPHPQPMIAPVPLTGTAEYAHLSPTHLSPSSMTRTFISMPPSTFSLAQPDQADRPKQQTTQFTQPAAIHRPRPLRSTHPIFSHPTTKPAESSSLTLPASPSLTQPTHDAILDALEGDHSALQQVLTTRAKLHSSQSHTTQHLQRRKDQCQILQRQIDHLTSQLVSDQATEEQHQQNWLATKSERSHLNAFDRSQVESNEAQRRTDHRTKWSDLQRTLYALKRDLEASERSIQDSQEALDQRIRAQHAWEAQLVREVRRLQRVEQERKIKVERRRSTQQVTRDTFVRLVAPVLRPYYPSSSSHCSDDPTGKHHTGTESPCDGEHGGGVNRGAERPEGEGEPTDKELPQPLLAGWLSIQQPNNTLLKRRAYTLFPTCLELGSCSITSSAWVPSVQSNIPIECLTLLESIEDGMGVDHSFVLHYECGGTTHVLEAATDTDQERDAVLAALEVLTGLAVSVVVE